MKNWLQNDKIVFLLSVAISVVMWWSISYHSPPFIKEEEHSVKMQDVQVQAVYNEDEYELSQKTDKIDLTLIGNKFILDNLPESSYRVFINLRGLGPGKHRHVPIQVEGLPINVRREIYPSTVDIELEQKIEKEVPVQMEILGTPAEEYQVQPTVIKPEKVKVKGTQSLLNKVTFVKATIDVNQATQSVQKIIKVEAYGPSGPVNGVVVTPDMVDVTVPVQLLSKKVPLTIDIEKGPPDGYMVKGIRLNQEAIRVYGPRSFLDQLFIYKGNKLDLSDVTSTTTFEVPIKRKGQVSRVKPDMVSVTVEVIPVG